MLEKFYSSMNWGDGGVIFFFFFSASNIRTKYSKIGMLIHLSINVFIYRTKLHETQLLSVLGQEHNNNTSDVTKSRQWTLPATSIHPYFVIEMLDIIRDQRFKWMYLYIQRLSKLLPYATSIAAAWEHQRIHH